MLLLLFVLGCPGSCGRGGGATKQAAATCGKQANAPVGQQAGSTAQWCVSLNRLDRDPVTQWHAITSTATTVTTTTTIAAMAAVPARRR